MEIDLVRIIYEKYAREIYFYLLALSHNQALAEDILQEVFYKAICSLPDSHGNIRAWLYQVARNTYFNEAKREQYKRPLEEHAQEVEERNTEDSILSELLKNETEQLLYRGIQSLPLHQQKIVLLQYFSGWSVKEIAAGMHLSPENVRVLSHRARKQLKIYMEGNGYEIS